MKTSKYGYVIHKLVDAAQEIIVTEDDVIQQKVWVMIYDSIVNRYSMEAIFNPKTNEN